MKNLPLVKVVDLYINYKTLSPASIDNYKRIQRQFTRETGIETLKQLYDKRNKQKIVTWRNIVIDRASGITFDNYRRHLKSLITFTIKEGYINHQNNIFADIEEANQHAPAKKIVRIASLKSCLNYLSEEKSMITAGWFWSTAIQVLYETGMRRSQFVLLRWKDINFHKQMIIIESNKRSKKLEKHWNIPIKPGLVDLLVELYKKTEIASAKKGIAFSDNGYVFTKIWLFDPSFKRYDLEYENHKISFADMKQKEADQITQFFSKTLSKRMGVQVSPHRLRHTMATTIANSPGVSESGKLKSLQKLLGHSNINTTFGYIHTNMNEMRSTQSHLPSLY